MNFKNLPIHIKFQLVFGAMLAVNILIFGLIFWFNKQQEGHAVQVDIAGKNQMWAQRISTMTEIIAYSLDPKAVDEARVELQIALSSHQEALKTLRIGGKIADREGITLTKAKGHLLEKIIEVENYFLRQKKMIKILIEEPKYLQNRSQIDSIDKVFVPNPRFQQAVNELQEIILKGRLLNLNRQLSDLYVREFEQNIDNLYVIITALFLINTFILSMGFWAFRQFISFPIRQINQIALQISKGIHSIKVNYQSKDELGQIGYSINQLTDNLKEAAVFIQKIGEGQLDAPLNITQSDAGDQKESLAYVLDGMRLKIKKINEEERNRNWATEGLATFAGMLRSIHDLNLLTESVISHLVKYLKINQGGIFVLNDSDPSKPFLEMVACYAYDRKRFTEKRIEIGNGLIGQVFLEKKTAYLSDLPQGYTQITSGLGEATPTSLLLVPLINNEQVEGVIELASFFPFETYQIDFVEKLGENIAGLLAGVKLGEKTKQLLLESQRQSNELRANEEENRQNLEEFSATQEEMRRKELFYLEKIKQLEENEQIYWARIKELESKS
jgi:uncharacterized membrane protein/putative methionine-R-sulfoxide reductase with GAF domain